MFRAGILAGLMVLAFLTNPHVACADNFNYRNCAWPILMSPEGVANFQFPDNSARYWVMPFDTQYETMTFKGTYPDIRYFSFSAYETIDYDAINNTNQGFVIPPGNLYDAQIAPDPGSINPFVQPGGRNGTYTVVVSRTGPSSGNTIGVSSDLVWVLLRMYVADADPDLSGQSLMGGVPLPTITVTDRTGASRQLEACSPVNKWFDLSKFVQFLFPPALDLSINEGTPSSDRLWFAPPLNPPPILWPNPDNKYMMMLPGNDYQPGRIIVIHGKAPGFPDTFNGSPIWVPSRDFRTVDLRFWALCTADFASPFSVINCATDFNIDLKGEYYTIVISDDLVRPKWLRWQPNVNWLPWGDEQYPKVVAFRNMLPAPDFHHAVQDAWNYKKGVCTFNFSLSDPPNPGDIDEVGPCAQRVMGDYYPVAVWCDKSTFIHGGWQACIKKRHH